MPSLPGTAQRFRRIFHQRHVMLRADRHDLIKSGRCAVEMYADHRLRMRILLKCPPQRLRRHIPGVRFRIDEHRVSVLIHNRITGCRKSQIRYKHFITLPHAQKLKRHMNRRRPRTQRRRISTARICRRLFLESVYIRSQRRHPVGVKCLLHILLFLTMHGGR